MNRPLVGLLLALFAGGAAAAPVKALLPAYVESALGRAPLLTSALLAVQLGCGGLFALASGLVSERVSRRAAVLIGLTTALFGALLFTLRAPPLLFLVAIFWGIASGFQSAGGQTFLLATVSRSRVGSASAVYFICSTASGALGAYVAGRMADRYGFSAVGAGVAALGLLSFALAAGLLPPLGSDRPVASGGTESAGRRAAPGSWPGVGGYGALLRRPDIVMLCGLRYFPTVAWGIASLTLPLLLFRLSGTKTAVGLYTMVSLLAASGAQLATGALIDRRARRRAGEASAVRSLVAPLAVAILVSAAGAGALNRSLAGLFVAGVAWTMSAWSLSTTMPPLIHELSGGCDDGRLVALTHLLWSAGMLTGTMLAGALIDVDPAAPFAVATACLVATAIIGRRFRRPISAPAPSVARVVGEIS